MAEKKGKCSGFMCQIEGYVRKAASLVPLPQIDTWVSAYFHPYETYAAEKKNAGFGSVIVHGLLIGIVVAVLSILASLVSMLVNPVFGVTMLIASLVLLVVYPIIMVIMFFVCSIIYFVLAKIVGGKGGFMEQTLAIVLVSGGTMLLTQTMNVFASIPLLGALLSLAALFFGLYGIYSQFRMIKAVHGLSTARAAIVILVPIVIAVVVAVLFAAALGAMYLTSAGASAAKPMPL